MITSEKGIELIKSFESLRLKAYKCPAGVWTIGYGHTKDVKATMVISPQRAERLLKEDIARVESEVNKMTAYVGLSQAQFSALVSFAFNVGIGALRGSTLLKKVRKNPQDLSIKDEFGKWVKSGSTILQGLVKRRKAEADLYFG